MAVLSRNEIESKYKWDLTRLFATDEEWEKEFAAIDGLAAEFSKRAGTLTSKEQVLEAFRAHAEILRRFESWPPMRWRSRTRMRRFPCIRPWMTGPCPWGAGS